MNKTVKRKIRIEGMHCSSCAMNIDFNLEELDGIKNVNTSYAKQETRVEFDSKKIKEKEILKSIQKAGYKAYLIAE